MHYVLVEVVTVKIVMTAAPSEMTAAVPSKTNCG
jgi:hypothetical protein